MNKKVLYLGVDPGRDKTGVALVAGDGILVRQAILTTDHFPDHLRDFLAGEDLCLALGDNIFWAPDFAATLKAAAAGNQGATVFGCYVDDPRPFGVVGFDESGRATSIEEKPKNPKSNYIVPGLYFYDSSSMDIAARLTPSARGELEITDVNLEYLRRGQLQVVPLRDNYLWKDAGNADSLLSTAQAIRDLQASGSYVGCIEEVAWQEGFISREQLRRLGEDLSMTAYGQHLLSLG